jgi:uncharacterized protein YoxC
MANENRKIIERANRMLRKSKALRKMSDKLLKETAELLKHSNSLVADVKSAQGKGKKRVSR